MIDGSIPGALQRPPTFDVPDGSGKLLRVSGHARVELGTLRSPSTPWDLGGEGQSLVEHCLELFVGRLAVLGAGASGRGGTEPKMRNRFSPGIEKAAKTPARLGNPYSSPCAAA